MVWGVRQTLIVIYGKQCAPVNVCVMQERRARGKVSVTETVRHPYIAVVSFISLYIIQSDSAVVIMSYFVHCDSPFHKGPNP